MTSVVVKGNTLVVCVVFGTGVVEVEGWDGTEERVVGVGPYPGVFPGTTDGCTPSLFPSGTLRPLVSNLGLSR